MNNVPCLLLLKAMWDEGRGSHHPDYDPEAIGEDVVKVLHYYYVIIITLTDIHVNN